MAVSGQTLSKIQSLAKLYQTGYRSQTVDTTIDKLVEMERSQLEAEASSLALELNAFESQYGIASADFYRQFRTGEAGDEADMFDWSATYQMWLSVQDRLETVRS